MGTPGIVDIVADKGHHSNETMVEFAAICVGHDVSEPNRGRRRWMAWRPQGTWYTPVGGGCGARGTRLRRHRGELLDRPSARLYEIGGMRRVHPRGHPNIPKRLVVQVWDVNVGLLMRHLTGLGTPGASRAGRRSVGAR